MRRDDKYPSTLSLVRPYLRLLTLAFLALRLSHLVSLFLLPHPLLVPTPLLHLIPFPLHLRLYYYLLSSPPSHPFAFILFLSLFEVGRVANGPLERKVNVIDTFA